MERNVRIYQERNNSAKEKRHTAWLALGFVTLADVGPIRFKSLHTAWDIVHDTALLHTNTVRTKKVVTDTIMQFQNPAR
jgi:hypothetical protein